MELFTPQQIKNLNELELLVYQYIIEHPNTVPFMRIRELAAEAHVSTTTVLHFCKKVGCDGYAQFKWKLKEQAGSAQGSRLPDTLGELQNFLDGHESPEFGLNRDEAAAERDRLQLRIYAEAITAFMKRQPAALPGNVSLRDYAEVLVDIAYEAGRRKFRPSDNFRDTAATLIAWGDEFSRQHGDANRTEKEYLDEICRFTAEKLRSVPSKDDPNAEFDIAFLNRTALERHGYDTATITDGDLQKLAERMGDYYCESSKFSEDLRTACGDFGLKLRDTTNPK